MKLKYTSIKVKNIKKSLEFYRQIFSLEVMDEYYSDSISVVMLSDGNMNLELIEDLSDGYGLNNLGFVVEDVDKVLKMLDEYDIDYNKALIREDSQIISLSDCDGVNINIIKA